MSAAAAKTTRNLYINTKTPRNRQHLWRSAMSFCRCVSPPERFPPPPSPPPSHLCRPVQAQRLCCPRCVQRRSGSRPPAPRALACHAPYVCLPLSYSEQVFVNRAVADSRPTTRSTSSDTSSPPLALGLASTSRLLPNTAPASSPTSTPPSPRTPTHAVMAATSLQSAPPLAQSSRAATLSPIPPALVPTSN